MAAQGVNTKCNLAVFISGRGTNLQALIEACKQSDFPARIEVVLSNKPDAEGLKLAEQNGLPTYCVARKDFASKHDFEQAIIDTLAPHPIDLVCLAGFMAILSPHLINHFGANGIVNIHPSLLPDYKGLDTHKRALDDGKTEAGCTVHYVTPAVDAGEIILQKRVQILKNDTPETLAARVLDQEHIAYPEAIKRILLTKA